MDQLPDRKDNRHKRVRVPSSGYLAYEEPSPRMLPRLPHSAFVGSSLGCSRSSSYNCRRRWPAAATAAVAVAVAVAAAAAAAAPGLKFANPSRSSRCSP